MSYEAVASGVVIVYPYLWSRQAARGETAGRKHRPAAVAIRAPRSRRPDLVILFPITTRTPEAGQIAVDIPEAEKRSAGLDITLRLWIILDECNEETIPGTHYIDPAPPLGKLSKRFFLPLVRDFIARRGRVKIVARR